MEKIFEDKQFHGNVTFFSDVLVDAVGSFLSNSTELITFGGALTLGGALITGGAILVPLGGSASAPKLAFGDGNTGIYEIVDNKLGVAIGGTLRFFFFTNYLAGDSGNSGALVDITASDTVPTLAPSRGDFNTGIGWAGADQMSFIAGGIENARVYGGGIQQMAITAITGAADGGAGSIIPAGASRVNVGSLVNDADDWVLLPTALQGMELWIVCNASSNFELRTPATSDETINGVDADGGANEYLCTDGDAIHLHCIADGAWIANDWLAVGGLRAAHTPHAN